MFNAEYLFLYLFDVIWRLFLKWPVLKIFMTSERRSMYPITSQQRALLRLFQLFVVSTIIVIVGGGVALLWEAQQAEGPHVVTHAAGDVSVVGPPTLSAATIDAIFARLGSPMVGTGKLVEQASRQTNIDDAFALAVWWTETNDSAAGVGLADRNPGSVRGSVGYPSAFDGYTIYPSYSAAIVYWFNLLRNGYVNRGLSTVYVIARPYVGTTSYPLWAGKVIALMYNYRGIAPPPSPPPVSKPKPKPTVNPSIVAANNARLRKLTPWLQYISSLNLSMTAVNRGQTQEINKPASVAKQPVSGTPMLPLGATLGIVLFGLLTAFAIAFYAYKLHVDVPVERLPGVQPDTPEPEQVPTSNTPVALKKVSLEPAFSLPTRSRATEVVPRRVILVPSKTNLNMSTGSLLDRYNQKDGTYN